VFTTSLICYREVALNIHLCSTTQITQPATQTNAEASTDPALVIQWLFPSQALTRVSNTPQVIGRDSSCDSTLIGHEVSRRHAELRKAGSLPFIRDLGSRNGIHVNGLKVNESLLELGFVVRIGEWVGVVTAEPDREFSSIAPGWYGGTTLGRAVEPARKLAPTELPVTIQGETGVGKEGLAEAIHAWSGRTGPLVAVNCAALPEALAEAELFGYRKGAFTGADRAGVGYFRAAQGGTLFLDEILELSLPLQAKLLRVIERRELCPIGETTSVQLNIRVIAASQGSLMAACQSGRFRLDLKARLDGLTVVLPPLRQRKEDIFPIFYCLMNEHSGGHVPKISPQLVEQLLLYSWPQNLRELTLLTKRLLILHSTEPVLKKSFLPEHMRGPEAKGQSQDKPQRAVATDDCAFEQLAEAIRGHGGNITRAAASLGISRAKAYRVLEAQPDFDIEQLRKDGGHS
jgi:hypothetical protein